MRMMDALLKDWSRRIRRAQHGHYETAKSLRRINLGIGVPLVAFSTFVGASIFATLEKDVGPKFRFFVASLSVLAASLASLQTLLRLEERAERHRQAGSRYGALHREISTMTLSPGIQGIEMKTSIERVNERLSSLSSDSPEIPHRIWERCCAKYPS
jgi:hypothetical protein